MLKKLAFMPKIGYNNKVTKRNTEEWEQIPLFNGVRRFILSKIEDKVEALVKEKIESIGYELYDVEYAKEGKDFFLRIFIDRPEVIDLNDCEKVNNEINELLDTADYIKEQYFLEVSSPGIERVLKKDKHLEKSIGKEISVKLFKKDENKNKEYQGILKSFDADKIELENDIIIERKNIAQIKTVYNW